MTFQVSPPFAEPGLSQDPQPRGSAVRLPLRQHAEPHPDRSARDAVTRKIAGRSDLEEIHGKPANNIGRRASPAATAAGRPGGVIVDYLMDYLGRYTLRHLHTHAGRERDFSRFSAGRKWRIGIENWRRGRDSRPRTADTPKIRKIGIPERGRLRFRHHRCVPQRCRTRINSQIIPSLESAKVQQSYVGSRNNCSCCKSLTDFRGGSRSNNNLS